MDKILIIYYGNIILISGYEDTATTLPLCILVCMHSMYSMHTTVLL